MKNKICTKCGVQKDLKDFCRRKDSKDGYSHICKKCCKNYYKLYDLRFPYIKYLNHAKSRCNDRKHMRYRYYGGKGIKCLLTREGIKELWFRDKAYLMKKPSIDRDNKNKNYTIKNCRFIELYENMSRANRKPVLQYSLEGNLIRRWISQTDASKALNINMRGISAVVNGKRETAGGFIWKRTKEI